MTVRVGINGFGRIGRSFTGRSSPGAPTPASSWWRSTTRSATASTMAFLLKHDSVGGTLANEVKATDARLLDRRHARSRKLEVMDPAEIPWGDHDVDVVIESTGLFTAREKAAAHLGGGAKRVVISAPSGDADATICMGVNDSVYDAGAAHRDLERVVHHELPRADGEGAQRLASASSRAS